MATITTRAAKGSALTFTEVDNNFTNLNNDGISNSSSIATLQSDKFDKVGGTISGATTVTGSFTTGGKVNSSTENNSQSGSTVTLTVPGAEIVRLTNNALVSISGVQAGSSGQKIILVNRTGTTVEIENESSSATAPNQIFTGTGGSLLLNSNASISLTYDATTNRWNMIGGTGAGTGAGLINYIENPDASIGITGYTTYDDGASAPVDGSGGSPKPGLWVRSTTNPLRGSGDFNLVKTGTTNYQGNGVAYDFTIDRADLAKVLAVTFDYEILSGTYVTGDLTVYIIQDPNGTPVVIQPAGYQVQAATAGTTMKQIATFQTASNVTDYRLCIHVASPSTQDYSLAIDSISVGPQIVQYGAPVTDWAAYTPTGSWVTNTTYAGYWRRVGDSIEVRARVSTSGAPTAALLTVSIPSGLSIDTTKAINTTATLGSLGIATINDSGVATYSGVVQYQSTTSVSVFVNNAASTYTLEADVTATVPFSFGANDKVDIFFSVPILGWSSTVQMSNDTDTRVVAMRVYGNPLSANAGDPIIFPSVGFDTHSAYSTVTGKFTAPVSGYYSCQGYVSSPTAGATVVLYVNGSIKINIGQTDPNGESVLSGLVDLNAGDSVWVSTGTVFDAGTSYFGIHRVSGPSAIAASETVAAKYQMAVPQTISASPTYTRINFGTKEHDSHGSVITGASWLFTVPVSGLYEVTGAIRYTATSVANSVPIIITAASGKAVVSTLCMTNSVTNTKTFAGTASLLAGDTFYLQCTQNSGGTITFASGNDCNISIQRIGNYV